MGIPHSIAVLLRALFAGRAVLAAENLVLRQQLTVLRRSVKRPRLRRHDRLFWVWVSQVWQGWRSALILVKPETVVGWHRQRRPSAPVTGSERTCSARSRAAGERSRGEHALPWRTAPSVHPSRLNYLRGILAHETGQGRNAMKITVSCANRRVRRLVGSRFVGNNPLLLPNRGRWGSRSTAEKPFFSLITLIFMPFGQGRVCSFRPSPAPR